MFKPCKIVLEGIFQYKLTVISTSQIWVKFFCSMHVTPKGICRNQNYAYYSGFAQQVTYSVHAVTYTIVVNATMSSSRISPC